ncbi:periplasmic binding protein-like I [Globomyces pollinis-pini]|nr:periplasmic binding protein-like I [Globomyces pollinis-pini]
MLKIICFVFLLMQHCIGLNPNGKNKVKIGISLGYPSTAPTEVGKMGGVNAIYLRIKQLNENSDLLGNDTALEAVLFNHKLDRITTIEKGLEIKGAGIAAVIGSGRSYLSTLSSLVLQNYRIPQCCGASTDPALSDKKQYPNFFRTVPTDNSQAAAMIGYIVASGWKKIAIIYSDENYGSGLSNNVQNFARLNNVTVLSKVPINLGTTEAAALPSLQTVQQSGAKIIIFCGFPLEYFTVIKVAKSIGLYDAGYVWIGGDALNNMHINYAQNVTLFGGTLNFYPIEASGSESELYAKYWADNYLNTDYIHANFTSGTPSSFSYFFSTCADLFLNGFDRLLKKNSTWTVEDLANGKLNNFMEVPATFQFPNVLTTSGYVKTDQNGDRFGDYRITNYLNNGSLNTVALWSNGERKVLSEIIYPGETNIQPKDGVDPNDVAEYAIMSGPLSTVSYILAGLGTLLVIGSLLLSVWFRKSKSVKSFGYTVGIGMQLTLLLINIQFLVMIDRPTNSKCLIDTFLIPVLFSFYYGLLFAKNLRIYYIFSKALSKNLLTDVKVYMIGFCFTIPSLVTLLVSNIVDPPIPTIVQFSQSQYYWTCQRINYQQPILNLLIACNAMVLLANLFMAFLNRNIQSRFNETKMISVSVYNTSVIAIFGIVILQSKSISFGSNYYIKCFSIFYVFAFNLATNFFIKIYQAVHAKKLDQGTSSTTEDAFKGFNSRGGPKKSTDTAIVFLKPLNALFSWKSEKPVSLTQITPEIVHAYDIKKLSLESSETSVQGIGNSWDIRHFTKFSFDNKGAKIRHITMNEETFQLVFETEDEAEAWTKYFEYWSYSSTSGVLKSLKSAVQ